MIILNEPHLQKFQNRIKNLFTKNISDCIRFTGRYKQCISFLQNNLITFINFITEKYLALIRG